MSTASTATQSPKSRGLILFLAVLAVLFFLFGFKGHRELHNSGWDSAYKSLQLFHLHYHPHPEHAAAEEQGEAPLSLQVARFGAGLWGLALLPFVLVFLFEDRLHRWWVRDFWADHIVVWGHCTRTLSLVQDLARQGRKVVFIGHCPMPASELPRGVRYLEAGAVGRAQLAEAALARASHFVALNESDLDNLELLVAAEVECEEREPEEPPLECYAHFGDTHLQNGLYQAFVSAPDTARRTRRQLFNYYDHAARILARQYPLPERVSDTAPPREHFVLVGFGAFGQCVALKLVKMGQQLYWKGDGWDVIRPRVTMVDPRADAALAAFRRGNSQFDGSCDLSVEQLSCEDDGFLDLHFVQPGETTSIVFCLENEALTLRALLLLLDACRTSQKSVSRIYLRIGHPENLGPLLERLQSGESGPSVVFFAPDREMFSADALLSFSLDVLARRVHKNYLKVEAADRSPANPAPAAGKPWEELSDEDRDNNREAADHTWAKLAMLGYELHSVPEEEELSQPDPHLLRELKEREEELARVEHFRWMTWRVLNGWQYDPERDKDEKLHPNLLDYGELPETTKNKDRVIIRAIPELLWEGRLRAEKRRKP